MELKKKHKKALILFMTAGDPSLQKNEALIYAFEKEGVDLLELGVPFSDPLADGPVIQAASSRALKRKVTLQKILALVKKVRKKSELPILLMSYLNPIFQLGYSKFAKEAAQAGVDGLIVPDLPPEEAGELLETLNRKKINLVFLLAPTSSLKRKKRVLKVSRGFVYYVSLTGVTGARRALTSDIQENVSSIKKIGKTPVCVGFGVSTPAQAREASKVSDGVIVGSAIVDLLNRHAKLSAEEFSRKFVRSFVQALRAKSWR